MTNLNDGMGIPCAGQMSERSPPLSFVTKLIFESPTNFGKALPIGSRVMKIKYFFFF